MSSLRDAARRAVDADIRAGLPLEGPCGGGAWEGTVEAADLERDPYGVALRAGPRNGLAAAIVDAQAGLEAEREADYVPFRMPVGACPSWEARHGWTRERDLGLSGADAKAVNRGSNVVGSFQFPEAEGVPAAAGDYDYGPWAGARVPRGTAFAPWASPWGAGEVAESLVRPLFGRRATSKPLVAVRLQQPHPTNPFAGATAAEHPRRLAAVATPADAGGMRVPVRDAAAEAEADAADGELSIFAPRPAAGSVVPRNRTRLPRPSRGALRTQLQMRRDAYAMGVRGEGDPAAEAAEALPRSDAWGFRFADRARMDAARQPRFYPARAGASDAMIWENAARFAPRAGPDVADMAFTRGVNRIPEPLEAREAMLRDAAFEQALVTRDPYMTLRTGPRVT